jgi:hypothetical protein
LRQIEPYISDMPMGFPGRPPTAGETRERMQRVRVGLTGLAAVGLIVVVATAVATSVRHRAADSVAGPPGVVATLPAANAADAKTEPLAQLGVAPDAKDVSVSPAKRPN